MSVSNLVGKKVKLTKAQPNDDISFTGILIRDNRGYLNVETLDNGLASVFDGDTIDHNGKRITYRGNGK